jgi:peroxiredoxin
VRRFKSVFLRIVTWTAAGVSTAVWAATAYSLIAAQAPDFALRAYAGGNARLSEHRGDVVVLSFWNSSCNPCGSQLEALDRSFSTYGSAGMQVFGISVDDNQLRAREFAQAHKVAFPMLADPDKLAARLYRIDNLPMTVLIDRNGVVRHAHRDFSPKSEAQYLEQLRTLLNE